MLPRKPALPGVLRPLLTVKAPTLGCGVIPAASELQQCCLRGDLCFRGRPVGNGSVLFAQLPTSRRRQTRPLARRSTGAGKSFRLLYRRAEVLVTPSITAISASPTRLV